MTRKQKLSERVEMRFTKEEIKRLDDLAQLCGLSRTEMVKECIKFSAHRVSKKYIKEFAEKVKQMPDPFDEDDPVFDSRDIPFEEKVIEKMSALAGKTKIMTPKYKDKFRSGYSAHDFRGSVDESDRELAEKGLTLKKATMEDLAEEKEWWKEKHTG